MKKILLTKTVNFDDERERQRIIKRFDEKWQKLLLPVLDAFCSNDINKCFELYTQLPYCDEHECVGREFVCMTIIDVLEKMYFQEADVRVE